MTSMYMSSLWRIANVLMPSSSKSDKIMTTMHAFSGNQRVHVISEGNLITSHWRVVFTREPHRMALHTTISATAPTAEPILPFTSLQGYQFAQVVSGSNFSSNLSDPTSYYGPVTIRAHHSTHGSSP